MSKRFSVGNLVRNALFLLTVVAFLAFFIHPHSSSSTAYADPNTGASSSAAAGQVNGASSSAAAAPAGTCAVEQVGWILCPIIRGVSKATDWAFNFLAGNFLSVDASLYCTKSASICGTYTAWKYFLNLANVAFVIALVIVIISQVTSFGISNYGIKRMLPRLIIGAIMVNLSYYICQLAVDLSNILGYELMSALRQVAQQVLPVSNGNDAATGSGGWNVAGILLEIATGALAIAAIVWLMLPVLASTALFALITLLMIIIILLLRKAFIVLLIVASPFAFVAYLLPNTEQYFHKWFKMFRDLLLVFPVVALLMGGGQLASAIILAAGSSSTQVTADQLPDSCKNNPSANGDSDTGSAAQNVSNYNDPNSGSSSGAAGAGGGTNCFGTVHVGGDKYANWVLGLVATGVAVAPLLAVWAVLQGAIQAAGAIGGKLSTTVSSLGNKAHGGLKDKVNRPMADYKNQKQLDMLTGNNGRLSRITGTAGRTRRSAKRRGDRATLANDLKTAEALYGQGYGTNEIGERLKMTKAHEEAKRESDMIKGKEFMMNKDNGGSMEGIAKELEEAIEHGDELGAKAAQNLLLGMGGAGIDKFAETVAAAESTHGTDPKILQALQTNARMNHGGLKEKSATMANWANQGGTIVQHAQDYHTYTNQAAGQLAGQTTGSLRDMEHIMAQAQQAGDIGKVQEMAASANAAVGSKAFEQSSKEARDILQRIASKSAVAPTAGPSPAPRP